MCVRVYPMECNMNGCRRGYSMELDYVRMSVSTSIARSSTRKSSKDMKSKKKSIKREKC